MFFKRILIAIYCCFITSFCAAQKADTFKIIGKVISKETGNPISFGTILLNKRKYKCDNEGNFNIKKLTKGRHKLTFVYYNFSKDSIINITDKTEPALEWTISYNCWKYSDEIALKDIEKKKPKILFQSGYDVVHYINDSIFECKYGITFYDFGCVAMDNDACLISYNNVIFEYLDKTFGKAWRKEIRDDALGFSKKQH